MKKLIFTLFAFAFSLNVFAQSAFEDAFELAEIYRQHGDSFKPLTRTDASDSTIVDLGRFLEILHRHYDTIWGPTQHPTANNLISSYRENPFFEKYEDKMPPGVNAEASALALMAARDAVSGKVEGGARPTGLNVAMLADGVAKFLVKRTKEELTIAFFEDFREAIVKNENLAILFPASRMILLGIGDQIYNFNAYLDSMREAFLADLKRLHYGLEALLTQAKQEVVLKDSIPVYYVADLFKTGRMLLDKASITDIIVFLGKEASFQNLSHELESADLKKVKNALRLLYFVSESVKYYGYENRFYVRPENFRNLLKDRLALDFYLGLLYERAKNTSIGEVPVADVFNTGTADRFLTVVNSFVELGEQLQQIKEGIENLEYQKSDSLLYFQYFDYVQVALDLVKTVKNFTIVLVPEDQEALTQMDKTTFVLGRISAISLDVRRKHYSNAVIQAGLLVSELVNPKYDFSCPLLRYGAFMAAVSECRNSDDVALVMETFALPRGSSYIKKHYPFNLSIGSYVGLNASVETLDKLEEEDRTGLSTGVGAPIGVAFSWARSYAKGSPAAYTFYLNVVDIGAFTAYRFTNNDDIQDLPSLKFDNLFAPGAAFIYGLPRFPGAIGVFTQRGPSVRKVTGEAYEFNQTNGWRFGVMASVDIPLFNLYTKGKKSGCGYSGEE